MKKTIKKLLLPLFLVLMVVAMISLYSYLSNLNVPERKKFVMSICFFETAFFIISFLLSIILILKFHIKIKYVLKRTMIMGVFSVLGVIPIIWFMSNEVIGGILAIIYPIIVTIIIAKVVIFILEGEAEDVRLSHIFAITFLNPFLSLLPYLMIIGYGLLLISIHGLGIK